MEKRSLFIILIAVVVVIAVLVVLNFMGVKISKIEKEKTLEELVKTDLTAPSEGNVVPEDVLKNLSVPK